jgi:nucleoside-diphosphate-sugar epimerase
MDGLAVVEPRLEGTPQILAGHARLEARPPRLEPDGANVVVAFPVATGIGLCLAQRSEPHEANRTPSLPTQSKIQRSDRDTVPVMRLLILGGTKFLGRATTDAALQHGHDVTLFNRGETNPELFPEAEKIRGDRTNDLSALRGRTWDAVVDPSGYVPHVVRASAEALADAVQYYLYVSSISVYADFSVPSDETSEREELGDLPADRLLEDYSNYGPLKALCEDAVAETLPGRHSLVRPGLVVGPHDPTGRFTYWPHRVARGGEVLAPAPPEERVQFVDARDLGEWLVTMCERRTTGAFNAVQPGVAWEVLLETCRKVSGSDATFVWVDGDFLLEQGVAQWMGLPMWMHEPEAKGIHQADVSRALAEGLSFRPLQETVRATLNEASTTEAAGLSPDREQELLEAWKAQAPAS